MPSQRIRLAPGAHVGISVFILIVAITPSSNNDALVARQAELVELDVQAGITTQPHRPPTLAPGENADSHSNYGFGHGGNGGLGTPNNRGDRRSASTSNANFTTVNFTPLAGGVSGGSPAYENTASQGGGGLHRPGNLSHAGGAAEDDVSPPPLPRDGAYQGGGGAASGSSGGGSMGDVMAHQLVVGCLVRLALGAGSETAGEVIQVLAHERGRARARERLGRGAIGPMEEVVTKVSRGRMLPWQYRRSHPVFYAEAHYTALCAVI